MSKYLLPCECGKGLIIDTSQAGQRIACDCGVLLEVPTLRGVRALEAVQENPSTSRAAADWDSSRGMIFAGSLILFVIGAGVTYLGYAGWRATPNITREVETELFDEAIDDMSLDEVYETWKDFRERGLGARGENPFVNIRQLRAGRHRTLVIGLALCLGGLFGGMGSMLRRRK